MTNSEISCKNIEKCWTIGGVVVNLFKLFNKKRCKQRFGQFCASLTLKDFGHSLLILISKDTENLQRICNLMVLIMKIINVWPSYMGAYAHA